jgi:bifunctional DNA-binding transcriptional regulator/antitoxin component of YhaV-PrlF toxin-antitoxin module
MKATIDRDGRIALDEALQRNLGVKPGDDVELEPRGAEVVIRAPNGNSGLYDGAGEPVNDGAMLPIAPADPELLDDTGPIRLPPRERRTVTAQIQSIPRRSLSTTSEE